MTGGERSTILVVDDVPDNIAVLDGILRDQYRVRAATDGETALQIALGEAPPDLILLDVVMPGMDGLEMCRRLKQDERGMRIPVIFVTARDEVSDESRGFDAGGVDYIVKPVKPAIVRARVKTHLELKKQADILRENARLREEVEAISRHDLKNPLMIVMSVPGAILADAGLAESHRQLLRMVEEAGRRMLDMINRTIDLYKMERGTYAVSPAPVNVQRVVEQIAAANGGVMRDKGLECRVVVRGKPVEAGDTFVVRGEDLLVYSMLANLIKNALEASPRDAHVSVSLVEEGEAAAIAIHNRGEIPSSIRGRFFEKFATAGKAGGTGLGAYSARLIARTLGGDIHVQSSEESGTTVTVRLPRA